jgi:hypothetical protein
MTPQNQKEILEKIKNLEDKLWDAISYISSDYCKQCSYMYDQVRVYEQEIKSLKEQLENERN